MGTKTKVIKNISALSEGDMEELTNRILAALEHSARATKTAKKAVKKEIDPGTADFTYTVEIRGNYVWCTFSAKPIEAVRKAMSEKGGRYKGATKQWYFNRLLDEDELTAIIGQPPEEIAVVKNWKK